MDVTICGPGVNRAEGFSVHAADCHDLTKQEYAVFMADPWVYEADSERQVVEHIYSGPLQEGTEYESCASDVHFAPCCTELQPTNP